MHPRRFGIVVVAAGALAGAVPAFAGAKMYRYVDEDGVAHYTSTPTRRGFKTVELASTGISYAPSRRSSWARGQRSWDDAIIKASIRHGVPAALVKAVVAAESAFNPRAVSSKGAQGLMQIMPETARELGLDQPFLGEENLDAGARYLRELHDRYEGSWVHALAAYNAGPTAVDRHGGVPPYRETRQYVKRVLSYYRRFHGDFPR
jgi:soluble lytic murein transglycosylase